MKNRIFSKTLFNSSLYRYFHVLKFACLILTFKWVIDLAVNGLLTELSDSANRKGLRDAFKWINCISVLVSVSANCKLALRKPCVQCPISSSCPANCLFWFPLCALIVTFYDFLSHWPVKFKEQRPPHGNTYKNLWYS